MLSIHSVIILIAPMLLLLLWAACPVAGNPDAKRLYDDLLSNYNKLVRPVVNTTDVLKVCIKLKLSQLIDVVSSCLISPPLCGWAVTNDNDAPPE